MHLEHQLETDTANLASFIDFAWLELTNRCNLSCSHCYTESGPTTGDNDLLGEADYVRIIDQLSALGCRKVQFIGGEPTLNRSLPALIRHAKQQHFEFIEVFSNLVSIPDSLLQTMRDCNVSVATSFYSYDEATHNSITNGAGSFNRTVRNIQRVLEWGIPLRAGIILMDHNEGHFEKTKDFLESLGVENIGSDRVREFGRAGRGSEACEMSELCGSCAGNIVSIGPDGSVAPCNMSRHWSVGSALDQSLAEILGSDRLARLRTEIRSATEFSEDRTLEAVCTPKTCAPYSSCCPSTQSCNPCAPNGCSPCYPKG